MRGDRLREMRERRQLTQKDLADRAGVHAQQVYKYEKNMSDPTGDILARLAKALDISVDYLVGLVDESSEHFSEDELTPMERRLIWAVRKGLIHEALKAVTAISETGDQPSVTSH